MDVEIKQMQVNKRTHFSKLRIIKNLICISTSFLFLFMAYDGLALLQASMNSEKGVGVVSQAVVYVGFAVGALVLPKYVIKKHGCKSAMLLGMALYIPYIASNYYPRFYTMLPTAALLGFGAALVWGGQCTYFNEGCFIYWKLTTSNNHLTLSKRRNTDTHFAAKNEETSLGDFKYLEKLDECSRTLAIKESNAKNSNDVNNCSRNFTDAVLPPDDEPSKNSDGLPLNPSFENISYGSLEKSKIQDDASKTASKNSTELESINAIFFGFHGFLYLSAMVFSNILSYFILKHGQTYENSTISNNCVCGSLFCNDDSCSGSAIIAETPEVLREILTIICVILGFIGILVVYFGVDCLHDKHPMTEFSIEMLFATLKRIEYKYQVYLIPLSVFVGQQQAFYIGDYTRSFIACSLGTYNVGLVTITYGLACVIASSVAGLMVKLTGRVFVFVTGFLVFICTCIILLYWQPDPDKPYVFFVCATLFGIITGCFLFQVVAFYGVLFKDNQEAAFGFHYLCVSIGYVVSFGYNDYFCSYIKIYIVMVVSSLAIVGLLLCERRFYLRKILHCKNSTNASK